MEDWYNVTYQVTMATNVDCNVKDFVKLDGHTLLKEKYHSSVYHFLSKMYPNYDWLPWKFVRCTRNFWDDVNNKRKYLEWVSKQLNIKEMSDWYKVAQKVKYPPS
jgi:hypothetical protein